MRRGRGRGGTSGSGFNRPAGSGQQQTGAGGKPKNTLKFENDFDFEQANKEFDTLRNQLAKTKIGKHIQVILCVQCLSVMLILL
jgi:protein LSM14